MTFEPLMACADCLFYLANGDETEGRDMEAAIQAHLGVPSGGLHCGSSDEDDTFSWRPCECCGSQLGGSRHQVFHFAQEGKS